MLGRDRQIILWKGLVDCFTIWLWIVTATITAGFCLESHGLLSLFASILVLKVSLLLPMMIGYEHHDWLMLLQQPMVLLNTAVTLLMVSILTRSIIG